MLAIIVIFIETKNCLASDQQPSCPLLSRLRSRLQVVASLLSLPAGCSQACFPGRRQGAALHHGCLWAAQ